jgi:DNA repair protein RadC
MTALKYQAVYLILIHNHPSGDPKPSIEDEEVTRLLLRSGKVLGVPMIDHVIIGDGNYYSFLENEAF